MGDPFEVVSRLQEQEIKRDTRSPQAKALRAKAGLEKLFSGGEMARRVDIPGPIENAMYEWGVWARRPQFWVNLRVASFCKILGMDTSRPAPDIRLRPDCAAVHRAVMRLACDKTITVLYAYYVANKRWEDHRNEFEIYGVSREHFNYLLKKGSIMAYNGSGVGGGGR